MSLCARRPRRGGDAGRARGAAARELTVTARVAFIPTSQSASDRQRAAPASASSSTPGRSRAKPARIASSVSDEIQSRLMGKRLPASS